MTAARIRALHHRVGLVVLAQGQFVAQIENLFVQGHPFVEAAVVVSLKMQQL